MAIFKFILAYMRILCILSSAVRDRTDEARHGHCGAIAARTAGAMDANTIAAWARRHAAEAITATGR